MPPSLVAARRAAASVETVPVETAPVAAPAAGALAGAAVVAGADVPAAAIAAAKERWLDSCWDGSSSSVVEGLYAAYRGLVIAQVASLAEGESGHTG